MNFKLWAEDNNDANDIARYWHQNLPDEADFRNPKAVEELVNNMADPQKNGAAIAADLANHEVNQVRYSKRIENNLLSVLNDTLGTAQGVISNSQTPVFAFYMYTRGIIIKHPPLAYDHNDKLLLTSVVNHELGHAVDSLSMPDMESSGGDYWDAKKYAKNKSEARRWSEQLVFLLKRVGNVEKVVSLLKGRKTTTDKLDSLRARLQTAQSPEERQELQNQINHMFVRPKTPFSVDPELMPVITAFLYYYKKQNESWLPKLVAPLALGLGEPTLPPPKTPLVIKQDIQSEETSAQILGICLKILGLLHLRNFVKKK